MESFLFETGINILETFIITWFYTSYLGSKYNDKRKYVVFVLAWAVAFAEVCIINNVTAFESIGSFIPIVRYFIYALLFLKGPVLLKLWIAFITHIIVIIVAGVTNLGICYIIDYSPIEMMTVFNQTRVIGVSITKIVLFVCYAIILKNKKKNPIKSKLWYMLIIVPVLSVFAICWLMEVAIALESMTGQILAGMICIVVSNIMIYYFYTVISREYDNKLKVELLEQQNENARKEISEADVFVKQMKRVRHDMKNHLITIDGYLDKGSIEEARNYIKDLAENYMPSSREFVSTGNIAFDAIVNSKLAVCEQKKIFMEIKVVNGVIDNFDPIDTGILFGNLIDNAIEAAEQSEAKRITLTVQTQGKYLSVLISNTVKSSVLENNKNFETTKKDTGLHGIGLKSVSGLVEKYDGMIDFYEKSGEFHCNVLL